MQGILSLVLKTLEHETSALVFDLISSAPMAAMFIIFVFILVKLREDKWNPLRKRFSLERDSAFKKKIGNVKGGECLITESNNYMLNISTADKEQRTKRE